jgi:hypothetical protein
VETTLLSTGKIVWKRQIFGNDSSKSKFDSGGRLNSGNDCYHSAQNLPSLSKNVKIRIYKTIILPVVLYGCKAWSLTLREEHRLRVFENRVLRGYFERREMR